MASPARKHWQRATAAAQSAAAASSKPQTGDAYQLMKAALIEDRRRLHDVQSIEKKIELKRELLPQYQAYIQGVLEKGNGAQDDVLTTIMVWLLDVGYISDAVEVAEYALKHGLNPAEQYQRSTAALLVEESADTLLRHDIKPVWEKGKVVNAGKDLDVHRVSLDQMQKIEWLTDGHDMHDQIRAKMYKAIGYLALLTGQYESAMAALKRALELNDQAGVKKDIERLEGLVNSDKAN